jgi:predicted RNase H-like nuclease (RuvC/YqgF family)
MQEEIQHLMRENEQLHERLRETMRRPNDQSSNDEELLRMQAKLAEANEKLKEKSRLIQEFKANEKHHIGQIQAVGMIFVLVGFANGEILVGE